MPDPFAAFPLLLAQNAPAAEPNGGSGSLLTSALPYVLAFGLWGYFLLLRPQQQQEKRKKEMLAALKKNDKVLTLAGIYGTVISVDTEHDKVVLRIDDDKGVKVAFSKSSVAKVVDASQEKAGESV